MRFVLSVLFLGAAVGLMLSCGAQTEGPVTESVAPAAETTAPLQMVELTAEGSVFDPPVQVDQIPEGAWYCDMGTVHYARSEEGDGHCAECGMTLTHRVSAEGPAGEPTTTSDDQAVIAG